MVRAGLTSFGGLFLTTAFNLFFPQNVRQIN